ncbi:MAG: NADH:ubiquinone reductase (Na(+)-transporting) subunit C [Bacteroidota bacterium]
MQRSNGYTITFIVIMTIIVGGLLASANQVLKEPQDKSIELDTKTQILKAVMKLEEGDDILAIYEDRIASLVVDINGKEVTEDEKGNPMVAENVNILKNFKKDPEKRFYPVFKFINESNKDQVDAYILPVYGNGLWDKIWGFIAVDNQIQELIGVSFAHKAETPGLGARITDDEIQSRFVNKKIYDESGTLVSVEMEKGEKGGGGEGSIEHYKEEPHKVAGLSGATMTARGVNEMLKSYLTHYEAYFQKVNSGGITKL